MNNFTKPANVLTWSTFKKKFNPTIYYTTDSIFGTKSTIQPTMQRQGFMKIQIMDIDEHYDYKFISNIDIIKDQLNLLKYTWVIYHVWKHRDLHGKAIDIYFK